MVRAMRGDAKSIIIIVVFQNAAAAVGGPTRSRAVVPVQGPLGRVVVQKVLPGRDAFSRERERTRVRRVRFERDERLVVEEENAPTGKLSLLQLLLERAVEDVEQAMRVVSSGKDGAKMVQK